MESIYKYIKSGRATKMWKLGEEYALKKMKGNKEINMGNTTEIYIGKLKARVTHLECMQARYEREHIKQGKEPLEYCAQYYVNSTEILTLGTVIRDLSKLTIHKYSYWDIK